MNRSQASVKSPWGPIESLASPSASFRDPRPLAIVSPGRYPPKWGLLFLSLAVLAAALLRPQWLGPLNRAWFKLGLALNRIVNPVVMGILFFGAVVPLGWFLRRKGEDLLRVQMKPEATTYWIAREPPGPAPELAEKAVFEEKKPMSILAELFEFMGARKKFWLLPLLVLFLIFGGLFVLSQGSVVAPFIYTLF